MVCDFATFTQNKVTYVRNYNGVTLGVYNKGAINKMRMVESVFDQIMDTTITRDIVGFAMGRNIINGAISLLGGISGLPLKDILRCKKGRRIFCKIIEESYNVCKHYNINVLPYNNKLDYEKFIEHSLSGVKYRHKILRALIYKNGMVRSSAIDDLQNGRHTELRCLLDCILDYGKKSNTCTKTLRFLDGILKDIETGKQRINKNIFADMILDCNS
jgi:ketopantoate reductase